MQLASMNTSAKINAVSFRGDTSLSSMGNSVVGCSERGAAGFELQRRCHGSVQFAVVQGRPDIRSDVSQGAAISSIT
jgi:hypothetical protein